MILRENSQIRLERNHDDDRDFDPLAGKGEEVVSVYACLDVSGVDVLDMSGASVVLPTRANRIPFEVGSIRSPDFEAVLVVARNEIWPGDDFCA